jgi:quinol monooxygenase YgiN
LKGRAIEALMVSRTVEIVSSTEQLGHKGQSSYVIVATYLPLRSFWNIIPFLRLSNKVEGQLRASRGIVRYALRTNIPQKRFWTISVWTNRDDMALFSRSEPHRTAMKKFQNWGTEEAGIAEWTWTDGSIDWREAEKRLESPMFHYKYAEGKRLVHAPGSKKVEVAEQEEGGNSSNKE